MWINLPAVVRLALRSQICLLIGAISDYNELPHEVLPLAPKVPSCLNLKNTIRNEVNKLETHIQVLLVWNNEPRFTEGKKQIFSRVFLLVCFLVLRWQFISFQKDATAVNIHRAHPMGCRRSTESEVSGQSSYFFLDRRYWCFDSFMNKWWIMFLFTRTIRTWFSDI